MFPDVTLLHQCAHGHLTSGAALSMEIYRREQLVCCVGIYAAENTEA